LSWNGALLADKWPGLQPSVLPLTQTQAGGPGLGTVIHQNRRANGLVIYLAQLVGLGTLGRITPDCGNIFEAFDRLGGLRPL